MEISQRAKFCETKKFARKFHFESIKNVERVRRSDEKKLLGILKRVRLNGDCKSLDTVSGGGEIERQQGGPETPINQFRFIFHLETNLILS